MFGIEPGVGIISSALPSDVLRNVEDEEDLQRVIDDMNAQKNETETSDEEENEAISSVTANTSGRKAAPNICPNRPEK